MDATETDDESLIGDAAHIAAQSDDGPRANPSVVPQDREQYGNLILLCKNHHKLVDDQPGEYTTDRLRQMKADHEANVATALDQTTVRVLRAKETYATYVEEWADRADLDHWPEWSFSLLSHDQPSLLFTREKRLSELGEWMLSRIWPKELPELEGAFGNFSVILDDLLEVFSQRSEKETERFITSKFYNIPAWDPERYHRLAKEYDEHVALVQDLALEITRAANLICDKVREYLDPNFRMASGVVMAKSGYYPIFRTTLHCTEYSADERGRKPFPYPGLEEFRNVRFDRDSHFGEPSKVQGDDA